MRVGHAREDRATAERPRRNLILKPLNPDHQDAGASAGGEHATAERFIRTIRAECLDWLLIMNRRHLEHVLRVFADHYNSHGPHRLLDLKRVGFENSVTQVKSCEPAVG